jgi:hypothetical protein
MADVDTGSSDKRAGFVLERAVVTVLSWVRRVLGSIYQIVFRDQLRNISRQTEKLGAASVESVTYLGSEVRALDQRLAAIERELVAIREILEGREESSAEGREEVVARPPR